MLAPGPAEGPARPALSLRPVADRIAELLGRPVAFGDEDGDLRLLENLRFDPREEANDPGVRPELADDNDVYVNDAFGAAHRAHASTEGVAHLLPASAGLLLAAELDAFHRILDEPEHPFVVVIGGVKVADKIGVIDRFTELADTILIGGAMAFTFLAAARARRRRVAARGRGRPGDRPPGDGRRRRSAAASWCCRWT